jgi:hypothetical protein
MSGLKIPGLLLVLTVMVYAARVPAGFALIPEPTDEERRFCQSKDIGIVQSHIGDLLAAAGFCGDERRRGNEVGC